ncbi:Ig-like domain-containing protein [Streptomyces sp. NPDC050161]|uniref:L,D-transpeptidase family protein n=1 Tax=Streptomyces sp. NPDC050161 TaxID=3365604 RepID=UPI00378AD641
MSQNPCPSRRTRPTGLRHAVLTLLPVLGLGALTACGSAAASPAKGDPVRVTLGAASGTATVQAGDRLTVTASGGVLTEVTVTDPEGRHLTGGIGDGGTVWTSGAKTAPGTKYSVLARTRNPQGGTGEAKESVTTAKAGKFNKVTLRPGSQGAVAGIAQPVSVTFDFPVTDRAEVEKHLKVTTDNHTTGSWGWVRTASGKDRVDWRPKDYWKPGTRVGVQAGLDGVDSGGGRYFAKDHDLHFTIGRSRIVKVDLDHGRLAFVEDGKTVKHFPVTTGADGTKPPRTGVFPLTARDVSAAGPSGSVLPGAACHRAPHHAARPAPSGRPAPAAPGDAPYRVRAGAGCIGVSQEAADWLRARLAPGDPFEITGSSAGGSADTDHRTPDWTIDWSRWQRLSALAPTN